MFGEGTLLQIVSPWGKETPHGETLMQSDSKPILGLSIIQSATLPRGGPLVMSRVVICGAAR